MAIRPEISLAAQAPDIGKAAQQGVLAGQQIAQNNALMPYVAQEAQAKINAQNAQASAMQQEADKSAMSGTYSRAQLLSSSLKKLRSLPVGPAREATANKLLPALIKAGVDTNGFDPAQHLDDATLDTSIGALDPFLASQQEALKKSPFQQVESVRIQTPNGPALQLISLDPNTNAVTSQITPLSGPLLNSSGLTPEGAAQMKLGLEQQIKDISLRTDIAKILQSTQPEANKGAISEARKEEIKAAVPVITSAAEMQPAITDLQKSLALLKKVKTGGFQSNIKALSNYLGTTSADAGELDKLLLTRINTLLQQAKGPQTDKDYERLVAQSASFKTSNEVNVRDIESSIAKSQNFVNRAKRSIDTLRETSGDPKLFEVQRRDIEEASKKLQETPTQSELIIRPTQGPAK